MVVATFIGQSKEVLQRMLAECEEWLLWYGFNSASERDDCNFASRIDVASALRDSRITATEWELKDEKKKRIEQALLRIERGVYHICSDCGKEIPQERHEALPYTTLCVCCKRDRERRGGGLTPC